jgi:cell wall-associated NlpC family hydrolase
MKARDIAIRVLKNSVGTPYRWGGDDPIGGFDCSGLVIEALKSSGKMGADKDYTADALSRLFPETETFQPGVLIFWDWNKDGIIDHVEMIAFEDEDGQFFTVGASGGNAQTTSEQTAQMQNAYVKIRPLREGYVRAVDPF